jgi:hypothetical protein
MTAGEASAISTQEEKNHERQDVNFQVEFSFGVARSESRVRRGSAKSERREYGRCA